jgi:hypothetical protein
LRVKFLLNQTAEAGRAYVDAVFGSMLRGLRNLRRKLIP